MNSIVVAISNVGTISRTIAPHSDPWHGPLAVYNEYRDKLQVRRLVR